LEALAELAAESLLSASSQGSFTHKAIVRLPVMFKLALLPALM